jgi:hypothetical protein
LAPLSEAEFNGVGGLPPHIRFSCIGILCAAMRPAMGRHEQEIETMTKTLALAASLVMLMTISGQAFAATIASDVRYGIDVTDPFGRQTIDISNAVGPTLAAETGLTNAYRYHGGPKSND